MKTRTRLTLYLFLMGMFLSGCSSSATAIYTITAEATEHVSTNDDKKTATAQPSMATATITATPTSIPPLSKLEDFSEVDLAEFLAHYPMRYEIVTAFQDDVKMFYVVDLESGKTLWLNNPQPNKAYREPAIIQWVNEGCRISYLTLGDIYQIDLNSQQLSLSYADTLRDEIKAIPQNEQVAPIYFVQDDVILFDTFGGESHPHPIYEMDESHHEMENLYVYHQNTGETQPLSQNGGVWHISISPDYRRVIFSDYDNNHMMQYYIYDVENQTTRQFTAFEGTSFDSDEVAEIGWRFSWFNWAKDGNHVIYSYAKRETTPDSAIIMDVNSLDQITIEQPGLMGWINESEFYIWHQNRFDVFDLSLNLVETRLTLDTSADNIDVRSSFHNIPYYFWIKISNKMGEYKFIIFDVKTNTYATLHFERTYFYPFDNIPSPEGIICNFEREKE